MSFRRIAIVNRGESAMRLIHAVRELNAAGDDYIQTVALHTTGEANAMFVREADLSYDLGPAANRPYVDLAVLEQALLDTGADAVWPGWGFVAEDPNFVDLCDKHDVTFIGPSADAMRQLGDKIGSKLIAEEVGVPVAPWSRGAVDTLEEALGRRRGGRLPADAQGDRPVAVAGGSGWSPRPPTSRTPSSAPATRRSRSFGNGTVFLERLVTGARHVEVQLIADGHGTAWALGVRDCSIQRRNQKVIEESSSPLLSDEQAEELKASAERLALAVGYVGAGTVEFLYHPGEQTFAFLEVNTRLQVEHSITEATTGIDLVRAQIHVAQGGRLEGEKPAEIGHAIEARLNAEDPDRDFAPSPGHIEHLDLPSGPGIRVDTGVAEGDTIPPDFDSMIAKIIAYGRTRDEALARLRRAMTSTTVVIEGGACNKSFVLDLLAQPEVVQRHAGLGRHRLDRPRPRRGPARRPRARRRRGGRRRHRGLPRPGADRDRAALRDRARRPAVRLAPGGPARRAQAARRAVPGLDRQHRPRPLPGERRFRRLRGADRRRAEGARRRRTPSPGRRRPPLQPRHRHARPDHAGRGRRGRPPGQPRRGRRAPLARAGPGRGHAGRRRRRGRGGRGRRRARVDEDGDGGARAVPRPRQGAARHHRQPGRDRHRADQAGAARTTPLEEAAGGDRPRARPARRRRHRPGDPADASPGRPERRRPRLRRTAGGPGRRAVGVPRRPRAGHSRASP